MEISFSSMFPDKTTFYFNSDTRSYTSIPGRHHYHNLFEIYYLQKGQCNYFIDNKVYEVKAGDVVLIPEGTIHKTVYRDNDSHTRKLINCSRRYIPKSVLNDIQGLPLLYRNTDVSDKIDELMNNIEKEYVKNDSFSHDAMKSYVSLLFLLIVRNENTADNKSLGSKLIEKTAVYIQDNFSADISLAKAAELFSVSPEHLSRQFRRQTGFGFNEYVTLIRLKRAEYILSENPNIAVSDVAYACGFNDSNYFSTKFKDTYGTSPLKYRKEKMREE